MLGSVAALGCGESAVGAAAAWVGGELGAPLVGLAEAWSGSCHVCVGSG